MEPIRLMVVDLYHGDRVASFARAKQAGMVALDYEDNGAETMSLDQAQQFLAAIESRLGRKAVLYSGSLIKQELGDRIDSFFGSHRLWLAEYGPVPRVPPSWSQQWLWQYSGDGIGPDPKTVAGIPGAGGCIDCNTYERSPADLATEWAS